MSFRLFSKKASGRGAPSLEDLIEEKRAWTRRTPAGEGTQPVTVEKLYEYFAIVGLPPDYDAAAASAAAAREDREPGQSPVPPPAIQPSVLASWPPLAPPEILAALPGFVAPGGVRVRLIERTPSLSSLNEIVYGSVRGADELGDDPYGDGVAGAGAEAGRPGTGAGGLARGVVAYGLRGGSSARRAGGGSGSARGEDGHGGGTGGHLSGPGQASRPSASNLPRGASSTRDGAFVFSITTASPGDPTPRVLYGVAVVLHELVAHVPTLARPKFPGPPRRLRRWMPVAPRAYCLLSAVPAFELHLRVLHLILGLERLDRLAALSAQLLPDGLALPAWDADAARLIAAAASDSSSDDDDGAASVVGGPSHSEASVASSAPSRVASSAHGASWPAPSRRAAAAAASAAGPYNTAVPLRSAEDLRSASEEGARRVAALRAQLAAATATVEAKMPAGHTGGGAAAAPAPAPVPGVRPGVPAREPVTEPAAEPRSERPDRPPPERRAPDAAGPAAADPTGQPLGDRPAGQPGGDAAGAPGPTGRVQAAVARTVSNLSAVSAGSSVADLVGPRPVTPGRANEAPREVAERILSEQIALRRSISNASGRGEGGTASPSPAAAAVTVPKGDSGPASPASPAAGLAAARAPGDPSTSSAPASDTLGRSSPRSGGKSSGEASVSAELSPEGLEPRAPAGGDRAAALPPSRAPVPGAAPEPTPAGPPGPARAESAASHASTSATEASASAGSTHGAPTASIDFPAISGTGAASAREDERLPATPAGTAEAAAVAAHAPDLTTRQVLSAYARERLPAPGDELRFAPDPALPPLVWTRTDVVAAAARLGLPRGSYAARDVEAVVELADWTAAALCDALSVETIVTYLTAVLLEQQTVVFCPDLGVLSAIVLALKPLLLPFSWQCLLLPVLPASKAHLELLDAPVPFVLGVQHKTAEVLARCRGHARVNAYKDTVGGVGKLPSLPRRSALVDALAPAHARLRRAARSESRRRSPLRASTAEMHEASSAFLSTVRAHLASLVADIQAYCVTDVSDSDSRTSVLFKEPFIDAFPSRDRPFMRAFAETQLFAVYTDLVLAG